MKRLVLLFALMVLVGCSDDVWTETYREPVTAITSSLFGGTQERQCVLVVKTNQHGERIAFLSDMSGNKKGISMEWVDAYIKEVTR